MTPPHCCVVELCFTPCRRHPSRSSCCSRCCRTLSAPTPNPAAPPVCEPPRPHRNHSPPRPCHDRRTRSLHAPARPAAHDLQCSRARRARSAHALLPPSNDDAKCRHSDDGKRGHNDDAKRPRRRCQCRRCRRRRHRRHRRARSVDGRQRHDVSRARTPSPVRSRAGRRARCASASPPRRARRRGRERERGRERSGSGGRERERERERRRKREREGRGSGDDTDSEATSPLARKRRERSARGTRGCSNDPSSAPSSSRPRASRDGRGGLRGWSGDFSDRGRNGGSRTRDSASVSGWRRGGGEGDTDGAGWAVSADRKQREESDGGLGGAGSASRKGEDGLQREGRDGGAWASELGDDRFERVASDVRDAADGDGWAHASVADSSRRDDSDGGGWGNAAPADGLWGMSDASQSDRHKNKPRRHGSGDDGRGGSGSGSGGGGGGGGGFATQLSDMGSRRSRSARSQHSGEAAASAQKTLRGWPSAWESGSDSEAYDGVSSSDSRERQASSRGRTLPPTGHPSQLPSAERAGLGLPPRRRDVERGDNGGGEEEPSEALSNADRLAYLCSGGVIGALLGLVLLPLWGYFVLSRTKCCAQPARLARKRRVHALCVGFVGGLAVQVVLLTVVLAVRGGSSAAS